MCRTRKDKYLIFHKIQKQKGGGAKNPSERKHIFLYYDVV